MTADAAKPENTKAEDTLETPEAPQTSVRGDPPAEPAPKGTTAKTASEKKVAAELEALALQYKRKTQTAQKPAKSSVPGGVPEKPGVGGPAKPHPRATGGGASPRRRKPMAKYIALAAAVGLLAAWFFASIFPNYLLYATPAIEADAVVLFLGPGEEARRKQVDKLVARGLAKFVIVPYEGIIFETRVSKAPVNSAKTTAISRGIRTDTQRFFVERTHIEVLQAQALMALIGATSANFVSSPYHMRRIKIMAGRVFEADNNQIAFVPTAYEARHVPWFLAWKDVKWVFSEWGKIVWYFLYSPFV